MQFLLLLFSISVLISEALLEPGKASSLTADLKAVEPTGEHHRIAVRKGERKRMKEGNIWKYHKITD